MTQNKFLQVFFERVFARILLFFRVLDTDYKKAPAGAGTYFLFGFFLTADGSHYKP